MADESTGDPRDPRPALPPWFPFWKSIVSPELCGQERSVHEGPTGIIESSYATFWTNTENPTLSEHLNILNITILHIFISFIQLSKCPTCRNQWIYVFSSLQLGHCDLHTSRSHQALHSYQLQTSNLKFNMQITSNKNTFIIIFVFSNKIRINM